jgi:hypothetical protein
MSTAKEVRIDSCALKPRKLLGKSLMTLRTDRVHEVLVASAVRAPMVLAIAAALLERQEEQD